MGLGGATKKLQKVADMGDELYGKINELRDQILEMRATVQDTHHRVEALENKVDQQGAILEALAEEQDIDVDAVLTAVAIEEAEPAITEVEDGESAGASGASDRTDESAGASGDVEESIGNAEEGG